MSAEWVALILGLGFASAGVLALVIVFRWLSSYDNDVDPPIDEIEIFRVIKIRFAARRREGERRDD